MIAHGIKGVGLDPAAIGAAMVGDRKEDILGAPPTATGQWACCGGTRIPGELAAGGATHLVGGADELRAVLGLSPAVPTVSP